MFNDKRVVPDDGVVKKQKSTARTVLFCNQKRPAGRSGAAYSE